ncbi:MAG: DUF4345 family protein [Pseudomonadota bacterium]
MSLHVAIVSIFFLAMGLTALYDPLMITSYFDLISVPAPFGNEIRAVYGGFGIAVAGTLILGEFKTTFRPGILVTTSLALFGMAGGRLVSGFIADDLAGYPQIFFLLECTLGSLLLVVLNASTQPAKSRRALEHR